MKWILLLAFTARAAAVVALDLVRRPYTGFEPWGPAWSLYHGHGFAFDWYGLLPSAEPSSFLPPLYSWILYLLLLITGGSERATLFLVQGLQVLLGTLTVFLVGRLARMAAPVGAAASGAAVAGPAPAPLSPAGTLAGGMRTDQQALAEAPPLGRFPPLRALRHILADPALLAAGIWAIYPPSLGHVAEARSQVLETVLLVALAWLILRWWTKLSGSARLPGPVLMPSFLIPGVVLGLLLLARPNAGLIWAAWFLLLLAPPGRRKEVLRFFFVSGVAALVVVAPWTIRNYRLHHRLIPIATNGGFNFHLGNNPDGTGRIPSLTRFFEEMSEDEREAWRRMPESERDRRLYSLGLQYWREQPGRALKGVVVRLQEFVFFRAFLFDIYPRWLSLTFAFSYLLLLVPFLIALPRCRGPACTIPITAIVVTGILGMAYIVSMRYRATVEPFLAVIVGGRGPGGRGGRFGG